MWHIRVRNPSMNSSLHLRRYRLGKRANIDLQRSCTTRRRNKGIPALQISRQYKSYTIEYRHPRKHRKCWFRHSQIRNRRIPLRKAMFDLYYLEGRILRCKLDMSVSLSPHFQDPGSHKSRTLLGSLNIDYRTVSRTNRQDKLCSGDL
jgi:hypothetical protein